MNYSAHLFNYNESIAKEDSMQKKGHTYFMYLLRWGQEGFINN